MADAIDLMVMIEEIKAAFAIDADMQDNLCAVNRELDLALERQGFQDKVKVREALRFSVARIVQARKTAFEQLVQLAHADELALRDD